MMTESEHETSPLLKSIELKIDQLLATSNGDLKQFFSIPEGALYAGLSTRSIRRLIASGKLSALRPVKGRIVIDRQELDVYVRSCVGHQRTGRGIRK